MRSRRLLKPLLGLGVGGGLAGAVAYFRADSVERRKVRVNVNGVVRFCRSVCIGLRISADYWWAGYGLDEESEAYERAIEPCHQRSADLMVAGALKNGGLYIKLGQGLSTFNHVLPKEYLDTLRMLQDRALAREFRELDTLFLEEFGHVPSELFSEFDEVPIAAASLAQVYRARTLAGKEVAVKAQYIDLQDRYEGDISTVRFLLALVAWMHPKFKLGWIFRDIKSTLVQELDFENEATNMERLHRELSSKRVLTAEWIDGCRVTDRAALEQMGLNRSDVAEKVITAFGHQLFHTGFVHADPHPGNIFIRPLPGHPGKAQMVLLDHGLYMPMTEKTRLSLCRIWKSIILHDMDILRKECALLGVDNYRLLAVMLTGRSLDMHHRMFGRGNSTLTREDWVAVRNTFYQFDEVMRVLRALPTSLILIVRNLNIVRSLNRELQCPVNRFNLMARSAIRGSKKNSSSQGWISSLISSTSTWWEGTVFEMRLWFINVRVWWVVKFLQLMRLLGQVPAEAQKLEQTLMS